jgi:hypothetical protein
MATDRRFSSVENSSIMAILEAKKAKDSAAQLILLPLMIRGRVD